LLLVLFPFGTAVTYVSPSFSPLY
jgi:hypothetical protein